jgi:hypothetical protein
VIVYDGVSATIYIDAVKAAEQLGVQLPGFAAASDFVIGGGLGAAAYVGSLSDLAIWNRPFPVEEVTQLFSQQSSGIDPALTPLAPSNLTLQSESSNSATLVWQDNSMNESGFVVERGSTETSFTFIASVPPNTTSYSDTLPVADGAYFYRVKAINSSGSSDYSNLTATSAGKLNAPTGLRVLGAGTPGPRAALAR